MTTDAIVAWLVFWLPRVAPWVALAIGLAGLAVSAVYQATRGRAQFERGYRDGQKWFAKQIGNDDDV